MNDPDPEKRAQWERIPRAGNIPTPEEWHRYAVERIEVEGARRSAAVVSESMSKGAFSSHGISDNIKNEKQQVCTQLCAACCFCVDYFVCTKLCPFLW